jgi:hypothetical protein
LPKVTEKAGMREMKTGIERREKREARQMGKKIVLEKQMKKNGWHCRES